MLLIWQEIDIHAWVQEVKGNLKKTEPKTSASRYSIINLLKTKNKECIQRKMGSYPVFWKTIQMAAGLSSDTTVGRIFFKCWRKIKIGCQPKSLHSTKICWAQGKKKRFRDEGMLKRIVNNRQSLKEIVLTKQGNKTKPLVNTLSLSLRLTIKAESYIWEILKAWRATGGGGFCTTVRRQDLSGGSIH